MIRTSNRIIKCLFGKVACLVRSIQNFIIKHGKVEGKAEANGVCRGEIGVGDLCGGLVSLERLVGRRLALVANGKLGKIAVIITLPLKTISSTLIRSEVSLHLVVKDL
jgi:hypothetical protein